MPEGHLVGLAPVDEPFLAVLADGLQQAEAGTRVAVFGDHQRARHQSGHQIDDVVPVDGVAAADFFDGFERAAAGEDSHPGEQALLGRAEEFVRPVDRCAKSRVSLNCAPASAGEHLESAVEASREFGGTQRNHPRRGQFDGERTPSSRWQTSTTARALSSVSAKSALT